VKQPARRTAGIAISALLLATMAGGLFGVSEAAAQAPDPAGPDIQPTPKAECGPGSNPETGTQGRVPLAEIESGRAEQGYSCNMELLSRFGGPSTGGSGGFKVERYVDKAGRECAYYDTTLLFPGNAFNLSAGGMTGVFVLDMTDPRNPKRTDVLRTPAMQSPHESVVLNQKRGLLAAVAANPVFLPGVVDIYDVSQDCRTPQLMASAPVGGLAHESGFAQDGNTFYVAALSGRMLTAIDVTNPRTPIPLGTYDFNSHGVTLSDDGNRLYMAANGATGTNSPKGLLVLDTSEIQSRKPMPQVKVISKTTWALVSTPQTAIPVTIGGKPYIVEMDEFAGDDRVGAARIIDMADEKAPKVISNMRLEVNQAAARKGDQANDPGADSSTQGYAGHYCNVPSRVDPGIVACTFILSGLRVFDIRDPFNPKEIAYFNGPIPRKVFRDQPGSAYAMSSPSFAPERGEIWYSDGNTGFYALRITNGVWPFADTAAAESVPADPTTAAAPAPDGAVGSGDTSRTPAGGRLPATGAVLPLLGGLAMLAGGLGLRRFRQR